MNFSFALDSLKEGYKVTRTGWNGPDQWVELQRPDEHSKMTEPYIYLHNQQGGLIPWFASQSDLMAEDWREIAK